MKISHVVTATDLNPLYSDFIPIYIKVWKELFNNEIKVLIILIADEIPDIYQIYKENIILFKPIKNMHTPFQAQFIRLLYPCLIDSSNSIILSDMDMIPMNRTYYEDSIKDQANDKFVCYRGEHFDYNNQIAMCYNVATPKIWKEIFNIHSIDDIYKRLIIEYSSVNYDNRHGGRGWFTDQERLTRLVIEWNKKTGNFIKLYDKNTNFYRLCRSDNNILELNQTTIDNIKNKKYVDYHMLRPFNSYREINNRIIDYLLRSN